MSPMASSLAGQAFDIVVVGSGIGGLTAALAAARAGASVLVLEAAKQYGGYCNPFRRGEIPASNAASATSASAAPAR